MALILFSLLLVISQVLYADTSDSKQADAHHPANDFSRHTLVKPKIYHGREKRQITTTKEQGGGKHIDHLLVELNVDQEDFLLDLTLNTQLIPKGFFHRYQENGATKIHKPEAQDVELCHYNGKVRDKPNSWVALSTCYGLSGVIFDGKELHYIETPDRLVKSNIEDNHYWYKHSNLQQENKTCGYRGANEDDHLHDTSFSNKIHRFKRNSEGSELVRGPYNANKESKYVELVLVIDNREFKEFGENRHRVEQHCKSIANIINGLYSPLNIFIALVGVVIWTERDEINFNTKGDTTLTNFLHYRKQTLIRDHPNDNAQLLCKFHFDNGVVGKALKGPMCTYEYSGGINTDHSPVVGLVATTIAHEMGHNFGMEHDTNECKCPDARCIMAPSSSSEAPVHWSSCSLNYLLLAFTHGMDYCLKNKPTALFDSPVCGNGFVEPGEQCDCGLPDLCDNTCCNAVTCMLHPNASCATGECCDFNTCRPKNAGIVCRTADYECDLPEYCTGQSEYCPPDIFKMNTESCNNGKAYCYNGFCRTRTDQCKLLWGETGKSSDDQCYNMNTKGTRHGNCGYNKFNESFAKCNSESVLCGMLHCRHLNERLEFGMESVAILSQNFINSKGTIIPCRTALVDLGINEKDPGLAPDGAVCGEGKMCVNQKCMAVESLRKESATCNCNANGWCNSLGHCHCKYGFAPPFCEEPGPGGSEDSGPASDPNAHRMTTRVLLIIFLGFVPLIAIISCIVIYAKKNNVFQMDKKTTSAMSKSPSKARGGGSSSFMDVPKKPEDNHSLLREDSPPRFQNDFFGHFKGFSIISTKPETVTHSNGMCSFNKSSSETPRPLVAVSEPIRAAPAVPVVTIEPTRPAPSAPVVVAEPVRAAPAPPPVIVINSPGVHRSKTTATKTGFSIKPLMRAQSFKQNSFTNAISNMCSTSAAPALPPPNPGSHARPIISSPVLENSTCTAKELISPLRNTTKTEKAQIPQAGDELDVTSQPPVREAVVRFAPEDKKPSGVSTLNRITSFLKPSEKKPPHVKTGKIDPSQLRSMEISSPILQAEIEVAGKTIPVENVDSKAVIMRAQSMRGAHVTKRPTIATFGSMRQPSGFKRPVSIPCGPRPKSPPPPRPPLPAVDKNNQYDDCLNKAAPLATLSEGSPTSGDNIYAVIEDSSSSPEFINASKVETTPESNDSFGLLGEIVSEIQNRNFDSIYSTSTLARKQKEKLESDKSQTYENVSSPEYKSPESVYSASTTSSGYIQPSAVNVPVKLEEKKETKTIKKETPISMSTFKSDSNSKPYTSPYTRPQGPLASTYKKPSPSVNKKPSVELTGKRSPSPSAQVLKRQITPPNLRGRKPSPTRATSAITKNRSVSNSPDLVTSCNTKSSNKPPDVLSNGPNNVKKPATSVKPDLPKAPSKTGNKTANVKSSQEKKSVDNHDLVAKTGKTNLDASSGAKTISAGIKNVSRQNSTVASLQHKFETKS